MSTEQLTGLQLAIVLLARIGDEQSDAAIAAAHAASDLAQRVADLEKERDALRARMAEIEAQEPGKQRQDITLNAVQLRHALDFAAPDFDKDDAQRMAEVTIGWREVGEVLDDDGHPNPAGYVAWLTEYPEEGCIPLLESWESATVPAQAVPDGWRPVPADPTEGGLYWVLIGDQPHVARFSNRTSTAKWWSAYGIPRALAEEPTHWMPIPDAPEYAR